MYDGELVRLRAMEPDDAAAQHRWLNDADVTRYLPVRYPTSESTIATRLAGAATATFGNPRFSVERRDTGDLVGYVALRDATPESRNAELELVLGDPDALDLRADAARTACRFGFRRLGLHRVHAWVFAEDAATLGTYEKTGFVREGVARDRVYKGGRWHDCVLMGLLADELA